MTENGFEYVDLGLPSKTMWATCNVGADKPEYEGLLFQFGRVDGYKYGDKNHRFRSNALNIHDTGSKYVPLTVSGKVYKENEILDLEDDVAHVNMGGAWRMPTKDDLEELYYNTTHNVETVNGVKGMMYTSNINGHQLFIPFIRGCYYNEDWENWDRSYNIVWSSQVHASYIGNVYNLYCDFHGTTKMYNDSRSSAFSVRGVFRKQIK